MKGGDVRVSIQRIALKDIEPNPYRNMARYHISDEKIAALLQSYESSGFWDGSLQARPHPTKRGKYEIAFGHHRIKAAKLANLGEVGLVITDRSNADMLRMMAFENRGEFKGDQLVAVETVQATIEAFGRGEIELPPVDPKTPKGGIYVLPGGRTYTVGTVSKFLGWTRREGDGVQPTRECRLACDAYHERANIVPALTELPEDERTKQATAAVLRAVKSARSAARRAKRSTPEVEQAAQRAAREAVKQIRKGHLATKTLHEAAKIGRASARVERTPRQITYFVTQRIDGLRARMTNLEVDLDALLNEVEPYRDQIDPPVLENLIAALRLVDERTHRLCTKWIDRLTERTVRDVTPRRRLLAEKGA